MNYVSASPSTAPVGVPWYTAIDYPASLRFHVQTTIDLWSAVCHLPLAIRQAFPYTPDMGRSGVGFEIKSKPDSKQNMHINLESRVTLLANAKKVGDDGEFRRFIEAALELPDMFECLCLDYLRELEKDVGPGFLENALSRKPAWMLRFLHYFGECNPGDMLAVEHVDKGGATYHIFESDPGLEFMDVNGVWQPVPLTHDRTVILDGLQAQYATKNAHVATPHRVVANEHTARNGRMSAVMFTDWPGPYYWKSKFGPTQKYPAGHFYPQNMPYEAFQNYFTG